jgi:hypothetical protein
MVKYVDPQKRRPLPKLYNESHVNTWIKFRDGNNIGPLQKVSAFVLGDFAESLLGNEIASTNNLLSSVVAHLCAHDLLQPCDFFERKYARLRKQVRVSLVEMKLTPQKAKVLTVNELIGLPMEMRAHTNLLLYTGWRCSSVLALRGSDMVRKQTVPMLSGRIGATVVKWNHIVTLARFVKGYLKGVC